jgi:D-alanyl-D-alanine carboxypeptidase
MTGLIALENFDENDVVTIGNINTQGKRMYLLPGEQITVGDLLYGALVLSANDAAEALANFDSEGRDHFIELMNQKAQELEMTNTVFKNPSGLENDGHVSSANDMLILATWAMQNPKFPKYVNTQSITVTSVDGLSPHYLTNVNELLGTVEGVKGVKTGWTENARENLVTYIEQGDKKVMIALMGSQDRFGESRELIDWIFENYDWQKVQLPAGAGVSVP